MPSGGSLTFGKFTMGKRDQTEDLLCDKVLINAVKKAAQLNNNAIKLPSRGEPKVRENCKCAVTS